MEQQSLRTIINQVEWKSDNYRMKETTSIQTGKRGRDMEWAGPISTCGGLKFRRDILGARSLSPTTGPTNSGLQCQEITPYNFWLQKPMGIESVEETLEYKQFPLKNPHKDLLRLTPSELQH